MNRTNAEARRPIDRRPASSPNIASQLHAIALSRPHGQAVIVPDGRGPDGRARYCHLTFRQLDAESDLLAAGMQDRGMGQGTRAALMVRPGLAFFALTFALFKAGVVPVFIDPGIGLRALGRCLGQAEPEVFIGVSAAIWARRILGWGRKTVRQVIRAGPRRPWSAGLTTDDLRQAGAEAIAQGRASSPVLCAVREDETAAILFTSGSTGPPKGAVYTHANFQAQIERLRALYDIEPGEVDLCTFPLFALFAPALGMTAIVPDMDPTRPARVDPDRIFEAIEDFGATNLFGSPALLRKVGPAGAAAGSTFPTLRRVVSSGAPASPRVLEEFARLLVPPAEIFTPYGATEALPVASIGSREILAETRHATEQGKGVCVGRPVEGIDVRIIRIDDEPIPSWTDELVLPDGTIGEIIVSGPQVTREYYKQPGATALAKISDPSRGTFHHRMGDLGYLDSRGRIWFCGRKSHRVVLSDTTLFTINCEGIFNAHPDVARTALVGARNGGTVIPVLCVEPLKPTDEAERSRIRDDLLKRGAEFSQTSRIQTILFHPSFPVDIRHNSKIFREKLALWAARRLR